MLKFQKTLLLAVLLVCLMIVPAEAVLVATMGAPDSSGNYPIEVDSDHYVTYNGGIYSKYEVKTTDDTLTAAESGTTYFLSPDDGSPILINLPDADVGLDYRFMMVDGGLPRTTQGIYAVINPQDTDFFIYLNEGETETFAAGDSIRSSGNTSDSLHIVCGTDLYWYTVDNRGTWVDYGTSLR